MIPNTPESLSADQNPQKGGIKAYSCLPCRERKIKCDRTSPCSHCIKSNRDCSFVAPVRGKRKRTKPNREGLHTRLRRYEDLLRSFGVNVESTIPAGNEGVSPASPQDTAMSGDEESTTRLSDLYALDENRPKLVTRQGSSRYYDSALWSNLGDEFEHPENGSFLESEQEEEHTDEGELFFDAGMTRKENLPLLHPTPEVTQKLKDMYVDRCDALMKILHLPTFWDLLNSAQQDPYKVQKSAQALVFAFYLAAISCLDEHECQAIFGIESSVIISRSTSAARRALIDASFLNTSSFTTLSAYSLYLMCIRNSHRGDALYVLSGVAIRLARKMGLHRDGSTLGLSPFETQMRRRLWWHLVMVDFRTADVQGVRPSLDLTSGDTKLPLNVNDEDLTPQMTEAPAERSGILPVSLSLIRCEMSEAIRKFSVDDQHGLRWEVLSSPDVPMSKKETIVDELESYFEQRYLRYYDPSNALHTFISIMVRSGICKMKLFAYRPRRADDRTQMSKEQQDKVFANAVKLLDYVSFMKGDHNGLGKFAWQTGSSYLWITMLYVLIEMRHRKTGPEVDKTWQLIGTVLAGFPQIFEKSSGSVFMALNKWTLDVWDEYVIASLNQRLGQPATPEYITRLRQCHSRKIPKPSEQDSSTINPMPQMTFTYGTPGSLGVDQQIPDLPSIEEYDFSNFEGFSTQGNDWAQWSQLFNERGGY